MTIERLLFRDDHEKFGKLVANAREQSHDPRILAVADRLVRPVDPNDHFGRLAQIHRFTRDGIRYQHDPERREMIAEPVAVLERGADDCDGKGVLAACLALAAGYEAQPWPLWRGRVLKHVQWAARFPGSTRLEGNRDGWIVGELTLAGVELGVDPHREGFRDPRTGQWELA